MVLRVLPLALNSGVIPGNAQGTIWHARYQIPDLTKCKQMTYLLLSLQKFIFLLYQNNQI